MVNVSQLILNLNIFKLKPSCYLSAEKDINGGQACPILIMGVGALNVDDRKQEINSEQFYTMITIHKHEPGDITQPTKTSISMTTLYIVLFLFLMPLLHIIYGEYNLSLSLLNFVNP